MPTMEPVPVVEGLFQGVGEGVRLMGTQCTSCNAHYFPKSLSCRNPLCREKKIVDALLGPDGTLYSYTLQTYQPPPLFSMAPWAPYLIGLVELPQGIRVMGMLTGCGPDELCIGMPMQLTSEALYLNEEGRAVLTYKFKPADTAADAALGRGASA